MVQEVVGGYRPPGDLEPPSLPLLRGLGWLFGGEQVFPAQWTAAPTCPGSPGLPSSGTPWSRAGRPGEPGQVGAAVTVTKHPPVVPELVELAEVPVDDPGPRLVPVAVLGPLGEELPHIVIQGAEHLDDPTVR